MRGGPEDGAREALLHLRASAEALVLPPPVLPGWSSASGLEYTLLVGSIAADLAALRLALDLAVRAADP